MDRRWWVGGLLGLGLCTPLGAVPAVLTSLSGADAQWQLIEAAEFAVDQSLAIQPGGWRVVVVGQTPRVLKTRFADAADDGQLYLGGRWDLTPTATPASALPGSAATTSFTGTVVGVDGNEYLIQSELPPDLSRPARAQDQPGTVLSWVGRQGRNWLATSTARLPLGAKVVYEPVEAVAETVPRAAEPRVRDRLGDGYMVPGDDPVYGRFAALAAAHCVPDATARHFRGTPDALYTRGQLADFAATMLRQLLDETHVWPIQDLPGHLAVQVRYLLDEFEDELVARGIDVAAARAGLHRLPEGGTFSGVATGHGTLRFQTGDDAVVGRGQASYHTNIGEQFRVDAKLQTSSPDVVAPEFDRTNLVTAYGAWDLSRHLTLGVGRLATRFGPGRYDLLWGDQAQPLDQLSLRWQTKVFGRPFELRQHTGLFDQGGQRYVTVRRYAYGAADRLTLALNFGLITNGGSQALASMFLPLYATRFVSGNASAGGNGNFLGSFDAAWQINPEWQIYGEFFADEFDFSPSPPATAQRIGLLGGFFYTPAKALPGTSYRVEAALIPDQGTYVGQQNVGLAWLRDGYLMGHPYGQDSAGVRVDVRQRFTPRLDVSFRGEYFRQLRSFPVDATSARVDLAAWYDLNNWLSVGFGGRHIDFKDIGGVAGNDRSETTVFVESQAGF